MKVTNGNIWQAKEALVELLKEPWPVKTSYWLVKLARKVSEELRDIERVRNELIVKYGTQDEKGQASINPESPNWATFASEFNELMAEEVEIDIATIALPSDGEQRVKPATLMTLEPFMEVA